LSDGECDDPLAAISDLINVGGIDKSIRIEVGGDLHEFGKLGRPVSAKEAQALI
jgi:hypothetical protein